MAIQYPRNPPSIRGASKTVWRYSKVAGVSQSEFTRQAQVFEWPGEGWEFDIEFPPTTREQPSVSIAWAASLIPWLISMDGQVHAFRWGPDGDERNPQSTAVGTQAGDAEVMGADQSGKTVRIKKITGTLKAGDFFTIYHPNSAGGGSLPTARLYMVMEDVSSVFSDGEDNLIAEIRPSLRTPAPEDSALVQLINPIGTFRLSSNVQEWSIDQAKFYGISFTAIEAMEESFALYG